jgi:hypothetical protein
MGKIYYVIIKGRTLEGRDLRALLARAVSEKRSVEHKSRPQRLCGAAMEKQPGPYAGSYAAATLQ